MMNIRLKEREEVILSELKISDTFKIPESSFVFMKMDVDGLTVRPVNRNRHGDEEDSKPIKVLVPEGKTVVLCVNTGQTQFMNLIEKVHIVELECVEIVREKQVKKTEVQLLGGGKVSDLGGEGRADEGSL